MKKAVEELGGLRRIVYEPFRDFRGEILKLYRGAIMEGVLPHIEEIYLSSSRKNVVRGLHFQRGAKGQDKFVYCVAGRMLDLSVDLRLDGDFGRVHVQELVGGGDSALFVPASFAHGVVIIDEGTSFLNMSPQRYVPSEERGVRWDSLGLDLPPIAPIITEKDKAWPTLAEVLAEMGER